MLYVLPGMGADHTMYAAPAWRRLPDARFLDWPQHRGEMSIAEMAGRIVSEAAISNDDVVIGSSLGGIVGCEIARQRRLRALILIGSAQARAEISALLALVHPLANLAPIEFVQRAAGKIPNEVTQMFSQGQTTLIRAMCRAIFEWPGLDESLIRPMRIHGRHDHVIPMPAKVDLALEGGHLIAMTHAEECVGFILNQLPHFP